jgi:hypothetical protein
VGRVSTPIKVQASTSDTPRCAGHEVCGRPHPLPCPASVPQPTRSRHEVGEISRPAKCLRGPTVGPNFLASGEMHYQALGPSAGATAAHPQLALRDASKLTRERGASRMASCTS